MTDAMPERLWAQCNTDEDTSVQFNAWGTHNEKFSETEYIRADVAAAHLDAKRKRIVDAIDAIVGMNPSFDVHLYAQVIKAAVWNDEDDPREILAREIRHMENQR